MTAPPLPRSPSVRAPDGSGWRPRHRSSLGRASATDRLVRAVALVVLLALGGVVTSWWAVDGGLRELAGWPTVLVSVGHLCALTSSLLLLVQVVLMSRIPVLERAFGQDRITRLHRHVGFASFTLMLAHVGAALWAHAAGDVAGVPGVARELTVTAPGMLLALAGTACLVLVVVTSIRAARTAVRYESWHLLHLYAYLGVALALPHQLWTGREFVGSPVRSALWWALWALVAGGVLVWRVAVPLARSWRHRLVVTSVASEDDGCVSVTLAGRNLEELGARAGHYFSWRFLAGAGWTRAHPYSLSAAPNAHELRITVKGRGDGSAAVAGLRVGTRVLVEGPYGRLTARARTRRKVALIGAGVGMTPIRALAEELDGGPGDIVVLHRFTDVPLFSGELTALARRRGITVVPLPGRRRARDSWLGDGTGPSDDLTVLRARVPDIADREVFLCGTAPWSRLVERTLAQAGVPAEKIHQEAF